MESQFFVTKITISYRFCSHCSGKGKKTRTFQGHKFTDTCIICKGTCREKVFTKTEVPLLEALEELKLIKKNNEKQ